MTHLRLPLVLALLAFLAGLLPGLRLGGPALPLGALAAACALTAVLLPSGPAGRAGMLGRVEAPHLLLAAMALAGAALGSLGRAGAAADCRALLADEEAVSLRGALGANFVPPADPAARTPLLPVRVHELRARGGAAPRCAVEVRVRLPRGTGALRAGSVLEARGEWRVSSAPVVPSGWPRTPAYAGFAVAREARVVAGPDVLRRPFLTLRGGVEAALHRLFPRHAALADALLLGRRETLDRGVSDRFAKSGLVHLLAISGTHVALIGTVLVLLGRIARVPRRAVPWLVIALVAAYLATIGAPASAVRSGIMFSLAMLAVVLQRPSSALPVVAAAALAILALEPAAVLDVGAQLSFAGVLGILVLRGAMLRRIPHPWREGGIRRWLAESLVVSLAAFLATAPIVAHHFGQVAPVAILANLPAIPLASLALVGTGAAVALEPVSAPLARLVADGAGVAFDLLGRVVDVAAALPGGHAGVSRPQWPLWAAAGGVFLVCLDLAGSLRDRVRWAVAAMAACASFLALPALARPGGGALELVFLDVGQGDAVLVGTPGGRWVMVDAGVRDDDWDAGERRVVPYLRARGIERLEALVLTHPHADHLGGAPAVLRAVPVARLVDPGLAFGSGFYLETLEAAEERGARWTAARAGSALRLDGVEMDVLWPRERMLDAVDDPNEISAVIQVRYGGFSALLTGDAGVPTEDGLVRAHGAALRSQVLKAGHHGSETSTSDALLDAVRPELVVISAGRRNRYGHPDPVVLKRLLDRGIQVARTDRDGTVVVRVAGDGWERAEP